MQLKLSVPGNKRWDIDIKKTTQGCTDTERQGRELKSTVKQREVDLERDQV